MLFHKCFIGQTNGEHVKNQFVYCGLTIIYITGVWGSIFVTMAPFVFRLTGNQCAVDEKTFFRMASVCNFHPVNTGHVPSACRFYLLCIVWCISDAFGPYTSDDPLLLDPVNEKSKNEILISTLLFFLFVCFEILIKSPSICFIFRPNNFSIRLHLVFFYENGNVGPWTKEIQRNGNDGPRGHFNIFFIFFATMGHHK